MKTTAKLSSIRSAPTLTARSLAATGLMAVALAAAGCAPQGADLPPLSSTASIDDSYVLGAGDRLQITLYGVNSANGQAGAVGDGAGQYVISESGAVEAPLVGTMPAAGLTVDQLKQKLASKLAEGYLHDPKISVDVLSYRPFYIVGEINHPGSYPCTTRSRVLSAVALAGGFTYRANEDFAIVERREGNKIVTGRVGPDTPILPDDVIRITQRYY